MLEKKLDEKISSLERKFKLAFIRYYRTGQGLSDVKSIQNDIKLLLDVKYEAEIAKISGSMQISVWKDEIMRQIDDESCQMTFAID